MALVDRAFERNAHAPDRRAAARPAPRLAGRDHTRALLADPYRFIGRHAAAFGSPVFEARLALQPVLCFTGARAAELFYDPQRFQRRGAAPEPLRATLFGKGGVQGLDGARHHQRKRLFASIMTPRRVSELAGEVRAEWMAALPGWQRAGGIVLYDALQPVLARAVCRWAGVPVPPSEQPLRARQLTALFDAAGAGLWPHLRARVARWRVEGWLAAQIEAARGGQAPFARGSPADLAAWHLEVDGTLLPVRVAAVEVLNLLRPTVAVSVYIVAAAHALVTHPEHRRPLVDALRAQGPRTPVALDFVREVRRHYPFFPALVARLRRHTEWQGLALPAGRLALLDLHGTNHDPAAWRDPDAFRPERFREHTPGPFDFVPQGGGSVLTHHRCPGEDIATQLMLLGLQMLLGPTHGTVPPQDLALDLLRLPARPASGLRITWP